MKKHYRLMLLISGLWLAGCENDETASSDKSLIEAPQEASKMAEDTETVNDELSEGMANQREAIENQSQ